jgi:hypothetical protein
VGRTGFEPVTHGLKAHRSTCFYLRKRITFEFRDTSATRVEKDIPVTAEGSGGVSGCIATLENRLDHEP